ncbi:MAG: hypothetical protein ACRDYA_17400 [Egibacteraceae bacterium]
MADDVVYDEGSELTTELRRKAAILSELVTQPAVLGILKEIADAPDEERLEQAQQLATVDALVDRGVAIPDEMRLTTRYFEDPNALTRGDVRIDGLPPSEDAQTVIICAGIGVIVCVTVGDPVAV